MPLALDLSSLLSANQTAAASQDTLSSSVVDVGKTMAEATASTVRINNELSDAEKVIKEQANAVTKKQEAASATAASNFFLNPDAVGYRAKELGQTIADAYDAKQRALETIQAKQSVSFLDNPLGFIAAQLSVDGDIEQYNVESRRQAAASQMMTDLEAGFQQASKGALASISTITDASANASVIKAGAAGALAAQQAIIQGGRDNLQHIQMIADTDLKKAAIAGSTFNADAQMIQIQNEQERIRIARADFEMRKEQYTEKKTAQAIDTKLVQQGYFALTGNIMPDNLVKNISTFMDKKDPQYIKYYQAGRDTFMADPTGEHAVASNSAFDAYTYLNDGTIKNLSPAMQAVADKLAIEFKNYASPAVQNERKLVDKSKDALEKDFNAYIAKRMKDNPQLFVTPLSIKDTAAMNSAVAESGVWKKVLEPLAATGAKLDDPQFVLNQTMAALRAGKVTSAEVAELAPIYKISLDAATAAANLKYFGLTPQTTYNVNGKYGRFNIADSQQLMTTVNKEMARNKLGESFKGFVQDRSTGASQ